MAVRKGSWGKLSRSSVTKKTVKLDRFRDPHLFADLSHNIVLEFIIFSHKKFILSIIL